MRKVIGVTLVLGFILFAGLGAAQAAPRVEGQLICLPQVDPIVATLTVNLYNQGQWISTRTFVCGGPGTSVNPFNYVYFNGPANQLEFYISITNTITKQNKICHRRHFGTPSFGGTITCNLGGQEGSSFASAVVRP